MCLSDPARRLAVHRTLFRLMLALLARVRRQTHRVQQLLSLEQQDGVSELNAST